MVEPRELLTVKHGNTEALVIACKVYENHFTAALVHSFPKFATDMDFVIPENISPFPYAIVLQGDLITCYLPKQVSQNFGKVSENVFNDFRKVVNNTGDELFFGWSGGPLTGRIDCRWGFKSAEGNRIMSLQGEALENLWTV